MTVHKHRNYLGRMGQAGTPGAPHRTLRPEEVHTLKARGWMPCLEGAPNDRYIAWYPPGRLEYNDIPF